MQMQRFRQNSVAIVCDLPSSAVSTSWSTLLVHFLVAFLLGTAFFFGVLLVIIIIILFLVPVELQPVVILEFFESLDLRGEAKGLEALLQRLLTILELAFSTYIRLVNLPLPERCHT